MASETVEDLIAQCGSQGETLSLAAERALHSMQSLEGLESHLATASDEVAAGLLSNQKESTARLTSLAEGVRTAGEALGRTLAELSERTSQLGSQSTSLRHGIDEKSGALKERIELVASEARSNLEPAQQTLDQLQRSMVELADSVERGSSSIESAATPIRTLVAEIRSGTEERSRKLLESRSRFQEMTRQELTEATGVMESLFSDLNERVEEILDALDRGTDTSRDGLSRHMVQGFQQSLSGSTSQLVQALDQLSRATRTCESTLDSTINNEMIDQVRRVLDILHKFQPIFDAIERLT